MKKLWIFLGGHYKTGLFFYTFIYLFIIIFFFLAGGGGGGSHFYRFYDTFSLKINVLNGNIVWVR